ncbi:CAP domain-containing protein [Arthrobacter sp. TWP1-1]|uniref:CAP and S-layer homology domain-containing protein n=1 Tax=Arthrobacter sp. TWP1-1 TaxID=2804568 RepID=UPI003CEF5D64
MNRYFPISMVLATVLAVSAIATLTVPAATAVSPSVSNFTQEAQASPVQANPYGTIEEQVQYLFEEINSYRMENGLKPLVLNPAISKVAQDWTNSSVASGRFAHNPNFSVEIPNTGSGWSGEIIGYARSSEAILFGWQMSELHNDQLLDFRFTDIGIGYAKQDTQPKGEGYGSYYSTINFGDYSMVTPSPSPTPIPTTTPTDSATPTPTPFQAAPTPVVFTDKDGTKNDTYAVPATAGVDYLIADKVVAAGTYPGMGTVTVTARAKTDYVLATGTEASWTITFSATEAPYMAPSVSPFKDVSTSQPFYKEMSWLANQGISTGWVGDNGAKTYRPWTPINRDAMAAFLYRMAGSPAFVAPSVSPFQDVSTSQPFYKEMSWLANQGISTGWVGANGAKSYRPWTPINRDAMAAFLYRMDSAGV